MPPQNNPQQPNPVVPPQQPVVGQAPPVGTPVPTPMVPNPMMPQSAMPIPPPQPGKSKKKLIIGIVLGILLIAFGIFAYVSWQGAKEESKKLTNKSEDSSETDTSKQPYTSSEHGFSIDFPDDPKVTESDPSTLYDLTVGDSIYRLSFTELNLSSQDIQAESSRLLKSAVDGVSSSSGAEIKTSTNGTFLGMPSMDAFLQSSSTSKSAYVRAFFSSEGDFYILLVSNTDQATFNQFADSFKFN